MLNHKGFGKIVAIFSGVGLMVALVSFCLAMGYYFGVRESNEESIVWYSSQTNEEKNNQDIPIIEPSDFIHVNLPEGLFDNLEWHQPVAVKNNFDVIRDDVGVDQNFGSGFYYWDIGGFTYNNKSGRIIYMGTIPCGFDCALDSVMVTNNFVDYDGQLVLLQKESTDFKFNGALLDKNKVVLNDILSFANYRLPDPPVFVYGTKEGQTLKFETKLTLLDYESVLESITKGSVTKYIGKNQEEIYGYSNQFLTLMKDGTPVLYNLVNPFFQETMSKVVLNDGKILSGTYNLIRKGGCGQPLYNVISDNDKIDLSKDLNVVGKNDWGENIYELKSVNHIYLKNFYSSVYYPDKNGEKISYAEFIAMKPVYFWVDPFGRLIAFQLDKFQPVAECGKPVIYLYPEKTTEVSVKLDLDKFTYSEPDYGNGWNVIAEPNGKLTETKTNKIYPYLFWEGYGSGTVEPQERGFVIKKEEVHNFLVEKLLKLGLNDQESADFREFWEPRMQSAPYYFVTFYGTSAMNIIAPLHINPQPDTVIRILMDYKPLEQPTKVEPLMLGSLKRKGFTVVEWGGVLR